METRIVVTLGQYFMVSKASLWTVFIPWKLAVPGSGQTVEGGLPTSGAEPCEFLGELIPMSSWRMAFPGPAAPLEMEVDFPPFCS